MTVCDNSNLGQYKEKRSERRTGNVTLQADQEREEEELDEDQEPESLPDTDYDDMTSDEGEESELVSLDAEDVIPLVDEAATQQIYDLVYEAASKNMESREDSENSWESDETHLVYFKRNKPMVGEKRKWMIDDEMVDKDRRETLWPAVFRVVWQLNNSGRLNNFNQIDKCSYDIDHDLMYEGSIQYLTGGPKNTIIPGNDEEILNDKVYRTLRQEFLKRKAIVYHKKKNTRPGWYHIHGNLYPVQTSYEMIEYLHTVTGHHNLCFDFYVENCQVWHPETDNICLTGRRIMEQCFVMDPSFRAEFVQLVKKEKALTLEEEQLVTSLFDEMNSMFNLDFESMLIEEAVETALKERDVRLKRKRALRNCPLLFADPEEAHKIFCRRAGLPYPHS